MATVALDESISVTVGSNFGSGLLGTRFLSYNRSPRIFFRSAFAVICAKYTYHTIPRQTPGTLASNSDHLASGVMTVTVEKAI
jgi:hypothetical protein